MTQLQLTTDLTQTEIDGKQTSPGNKSRNKGRMNIVFPVNLGGERTQLYILNLSQKPTEYRTRENRLVFIIFKCLLFCFSLKSSQQQLLTQHTKNIIVNHHNIGCKPSL